MYIMRLIYWLAIVSFASCCLSASQPQTYSGDGVSFVCPGGWSLKQYYPQTTNGVRRADCALGNTATFAIRWERVRDNDTSVWSEDSKREFAREVRSDIEAMEVKTMDRVLDISPPQAANLRGNPVLFVKVRITYPEEQRASFRFARIKCGKYRVTMAMGAMDANTQAAAALSEMEGSLRCG
jgi:hypothetical protein